jgi:arylsulfatase A-like enzyme
MAGLLVSTLGCLPETEGPVETPRPNIILIVLDTTRADILSAYGYAKETSPNLASLAHEGILFEQATSTDFWTLPAHASLLTGQYPSDHNATSETNLLQPGVRTLAESLSAAGYKTQAYVSNAWIGAERGFDQGFDGFVETWKTGGLQGSEFGLDRAAIEGAEAWIAERDPLGEEFFLFLNLNSAHMPYSPDPMVLADLSPGPRSIERTRRLRMLKGMWAYLGGDFELDAKDFAILRELYEAEIAMLDALVGRLVEFLRAREILDETLVIVTSDHGENLGDHGMIDHLLSMYQTTTRVPLIMRHPPSFSPGRRSQNVVSLVDIVPTVLDIAGLADLYPELSGGSLVSPRHSPERAVFAENDRPLNGIDLMRANYPDFDLATIDGRMRMIRTHQYKLIWKEDGSTELFDLIADPEELDDLSEQAPELREKLLARLRSWMTSQELGGGGNAEPPRMQVMDPETRQQLRSLGYIE